MSVPPNKRNKNRVYKLQICLYSRKKASPKGFLNLRDALVPALYIVPFRIHLAYDSMNLPKKQ